MDTRTRLIVTLYVIACLVLLLHDLGLLTQMIRG
jgi:hypothetical protein